MEKLQLIAGIFSNEEAHEILNNVFTAKIHFHAMKNFSSEERFGSPDAIARKRIPELTEELVKVERIIQEAKAKGKKLAISSEINIAFID